MLDFFVSLRLRQSRNYRVFSNERRDNESPKNREMIQNHQKTVTDPQIPVFDFKYKSIKDRIRNEKITDKSRCKSRNVFIIYLSYL